MHSKHTGSTERLQQQLEKQEEDKQMNLAQKIETKKQDEKTS